MSIRTTAGSLWDILDAISSEILANPNPVSEISRLIELRYEYGTALPDGLFLNRDAPFFCNFCHHIKRDGEFHQPSDDFCLPGKGGAS